MLPVRRLIPFRSIVPYQLSGFYINYQETILLHASNNLHCVHFTELLLTVLRYLHMKDSRGMCVRI